MTPRCPSCGFLTPAPGLCAVCASGAPVHRVTAADLQAAYAAALAGTPTPPRLASTPPHGHAAGTPRPARLPQTPQPYSCDLPGCAGTLLLTPASYARLRGARRTIRCPPCRQAQRRTSMRRDMGQQRGPSGAGLLQTMPCSTPACSGTRTFTQREARRLQSRGVPLRCPGCATAARRASNRAWAQRQQAGAPQAPGGL